MIPLQVTADLRGYTELGPAQLWPALDAILAAAVARRASMVAPVTPEELEPIDLPIELEPGGRFHLASVGHPDGWLRDISVHIHRTPPLQRYEQLLAPESPFRRIDISVEPDKQLRIPKVAHAHRRMFWWCIGDAQTIAELLGGVTRIGARRRHGRGAVSRWSVEPCATWDGFPVMRDGRPLRNLPLDWPGLRDPVPRYGNLTFPYWMREREQLLAMPEGHH